MESNTFFWRIFFHRSSICFFIIITFFLSCILRVAVISASDYEAVRSSQNSLRLIAAKLRGTVYDRNMIPITNNKKTIVAAVSATPRAITAISSVLEGDELLTTLELLKKGKPVLCTLPRKIECDGIVCTEIYSTSSPLSQHLIGYTNSDNMGMSGIEKAYNDILYSNETVDFSFECSGNGSILEGIAPTVNNNSSVTAGGVVTTLDVNIQSIAEDEAAALGSGAIIIAEAKNGEILASVSTPFYDKENLEEYLTLPNSPLLNRAINAYNVGSVFKPCVAIAGLKNNKGSYHYTCTGFTEIMTRNFKCHNTAGHGLMNLRLGLANSCNTYFYNFALSIGYESIYNMASSLKFGSTLKLCDGIYTAKGSIPQKESLQNDAYLANFSIGQGELLLSPISILTLYLSIASNGSYYIPSIVKGTLKNAVFSEYDKGNPTKVFDEKTAQTLREYLKSVLTEGTGKEALPKTVSAAGKTATAQTGKYQNGAEICCGWFCGFFPAESPKYVAVVFSENTLDQTKNCNQIFSSLVDRIWSLE